MFAKFLDVIYIPPEPQTMAQISDPISISGGSSIGQIAAAVIMAIFLAAALISAAVYVSKHSNPNREA